MKTTDVSYNKNTTLLEKKERNYDFASQQENKYLTLTNKYTNGSSNNSMINNPNNINNNFNKMNNLNNQQNIKIQSRAIDNYINNSNQDEYFKEKFKQNDLSYSEIDDSKISESEQLSSYAPSEKTKGRLFKFFN